MGVLERARTTRLEHRIGPRLDAAWDRTGTLLSSVREVQDNLESVLARAETLAALARDSAGAGRLLHDDAAYARMANAVNPYGDGQAARRIAEAISAFFGKR